MSIRTIILRWLPTLFAFPLGGQLVVWLVGEVNDYTSAGIAGTIVGAIIGLFQYAILRSIAVNSRWIWGSMVGMACGSLIGYHIIGTDTTITALVSKGFISGMIVGCAQIISQGRSISEIVLWSTTTAIAWTVGWFITANVIVDVQFHYAIFGSSGAFVATAILAFVINTCLLTNTTPTGVPHA